MWFWGDLLVIAERPRLPRRASPSSQRRWVGACSNISQGRLAAQHPVNLKEILHYVQDDVINLLPQLLYPLP
jgi:hypothetical protein